MAEKCDLCLWNQGSGGGGGGGGSSGVLELHVDPQTGALDKTWQEIYDQVSAGVFCFAINHFSFDGFTGVDQIFVTSVEDQTQAETGNGYVVFFYGGTMYSAQTPNDYPSA